MYQREPCMALVQTRLLAEVLISYMYGLFAKSKYPWVLQIGIGNKALECQVFSGRLLCYSVSPHVRAHAASHTVTELICKSGHCD